RRQYQVDAPRRGRASLREINRARFVNFLRRWRLGFLLGFLNVEKVSTANLPDPNDAPTRAVRRLLDVRDVQDALVEAAWAQGLPPPLVEEMHRATVTPKFNPNPTERDFYTYRVDVPVRGKTLSVMLKWFDSQGRYPDLPDEIKIARAEESVAAIVNLNV